MNRFRSDREQDQVHPSYDQEVDRGATASGKETASRLESAVANNDQSAYDKVMQEVNAFRDNHTGYTGTSQYTDYINSIVNKLESDGKLHAVELFAANKNFDDMDRAGTGRLDRDKAESFKGDNYLDTHFSRRGERLADADGKGVSKQGLQSALQSEIQQRDADWLFERRRDGTRPLFDSMKDKGAEDIKEKLKSDNNLSPQERRSLEWAADRLEARGGNLGELAAAHKNLEHLFRKGEDGTSLYDKMKDTAGNITKWPNPTFYGWSSVDPNFRVEDAIKYLLTPYAPNEYPLRPVKPSQDFPEPSDSKALADWKALSWLQSQRTLASRLPGSDYYMTADTLRDLAQKAGVPAPITDTQRTPRENLSTLFERNNSDGRSLYARLKDDKGHIPHGAVDEMLQSNPHLTPRQKEALEYLKSQFDLLTPYAPKSIFYGSKDLYFNQLVNLAHNEGLLVH